LCANTPAVSTGCKGDRHGQGSDAQQQGKEETKGRQEYQEGRRYALSVLVRKDDDRPKPNRQEALTTIIEEEGKEFVALRSPETAEHKPDYREPGRFPSREKALAFLSADG
jgi:hypothetical protein